MAVKVNMKLLHLMNKGPQRLQKHLYYSYTGSLNSSCVLEISISAQFDAFGLLTHLPSLIFIQGSLFFKIKQRKEREWDGFVLNAFGSILKVK